PPAARQPAKPSRIRRAAPDRARRPAPQRQAARPRAAPARPAKPRGTPRFPARAFSRALLPAERAFASPNRPSQKSREPAKRRLSEKTPASAVWAASVVPCAMAGGDPFVLLQASPEPRRAGRGLAHHRNIGT